VLDQPAVAPEARYSGVSLCERVFRTPVNGVALDLDDLFHKGKICGVQEGHSNRTLTRLFPNKECVNVHEIDHVKLSGVWVHFPQR
jgi:hypothetical protein